jgi:hypothetical protein
MDDTIQGPMHDGIRWRRGHWKGPAKQPKPHRIPPDLKKPHRYAPPLAYHPILQTLSSSGQAALHSTHTDRTLWSIVVTPQRVWRSDPINIHTSIRGKHNAQHGEPTAALSTRYPRQTDPDRQILSTLDSHQHHAAACVQGSSHTTALLLVFFLLLNLIFNLSGVDSEITPTTITPHTYRYKRLNFIGVRGNHPHRHPGPAARDSDTHVLIPYYIIQSQHVSLAGFF